jgi:hypothetical protein
LNTNAIRAKDPSITNAVTATPAISAHSHVGPACNNVIPDPTATRSAAIFSAFAPTKPTSKVPTISRAAPPGQRCGTNSPSDFPVANAVRSQISCTAVISGNVTTLTHSSPYPCAAPAWLYVATPDGSSSLAPVIRPGPTARR